jgi:hypothetical protein
MNSRQLCNDQVGRRGPARFPHRFFFALGFAAALSFSDPLAASAATLVGPYSFAVGDVFTFAYNSTTSLQKGSGAPTVATQSYIETTTILPPVNFAYASGHVAKAYPFETRGSSTTSAGTLTYTEVVYRNFVTNSGVKDYLEYGYTTTSNLLRPDNVTKHLSTTRTFTTPFLLDQLPEKSNATWKQPIDFKDVINDYYSHPTGPGDTNILQSTTTRSADGSYIDSGMDFDVPFTIVQKPNGTGTLTIGPASTPEQWEFGLPKSSGKGEIIPVIVSFVGKTGFNSVPDWFPGHGSPANPLTTLSMADKGTQAVPAGCGKYAGKPSTLLQLTYDQLSPVGGYTFQETDDFYVISNVGRVCVTKAYTKTNYDQKVTGKVISVDTFSSTAGLVSETLH